MMALKILRACIIERVKCLKAGRFNAIGQSWGQICKKLDEQISVTEFIKTIFTSWKSDPERSKLVGYASFGIGCAISESIETIEREIHHCHYIVCTHAVDGLKLKNHKPTEKCEKNVENELKNLCAKNEIHKFTHDQTWFNADAIIPSVVAEWENEIQEEYRLLDVYKNKEFKRKTVN